MENVTVQEGFPTVFTLEKNANIGDLKQWLPDHQPEIQQHLLKHGALLFRNFPLNGAKHFSNFITAMNLGKFVNYVGGDSPRDQIEPAVYTSTEAPPSIHIPLHQELSYMRNSPAHIYFYCDIEPTFQGETVIADARKVYAALDPNVIARFEQKGLTYISHYYQKSKLMALVNYFARSHKSWSDVFETENKEEVEAFCHANQISWQWLRKNWIELKHTTPALRQHPVTKETVWFNQAHLYDFNPKLLGILNFLAVKLVYFRRMTRLHEVTFGDGTTIPRADLYHILDTLQKHTVSYPWKQGDVLILDNILAMHGRATFKGKRRILTALTS